MLNYIRRRKRILIAGAVGVAGAALAYHLWHQDDDSDELEANWSQQSETAQPSSQDLDGSLADHFQYIQGEAAPDQLELLMPRLQALLYKMTDVPSNVAALAPDSTIKAKLHVMAQHSLARPLATVWIIPLVDLLVRAKLNFIGRHVFLEEKLLKLRQPNSQDGLRMRIGTGLCGQSAHGSMRAPPLPPRIQGKAIEAFLLCTYMETAGVPWLIQQVLDVVSAHLSAEDLQTPRSPAELCQLLELLHANVREALAQGLTNWTQLLLGDTSAPGPHNEHDGRQTPGGLHGPPTVHIALASPVLQDPQVAAVEAELQRDLRAALCSSTFTHAVDAAVQQTLRILLSVVQELFPDDAPLPVHAPALAAATHSRPQNKQGSYGGGGASVDVTLSLDQTSPEQQRTPQPEQQQQQQGGMEQVAWLGPPAASEHARSLRGIVYGAGRALYASVAWMLGRSVSVGMLGPADLAAHQLAVKSSNSLHEYDTPKPARPLARLLKPTQAASDALFLRAHELSKGTAHLGPVLAFSASIFAKPVHDSSPMFAQMY